MKKQFVWIMTDSTRLDMLGCYGDPAISPLNVDELHDRIIRWMNETCDASRIKGI